MRNLFDFLPQNCYNILTDRPAFVCEYKGDTQKGEDWISEYIKKFIKGGRAAMDKDIRILGEQNGVIEYAELNLLDRRVYDNLVAKEAELEQAIAEANADLESVRAEKAKYEYIIQLADEAKAKAEQEAAAVATPTNEAPNTDIVQ